MKIFAMGIDENGRSTNTFVDIPLAKVSETESLSAKQPGTQWRIGFRAITPASRASGSYTSPGGPHEMHVGGPPHFIGIMSGHAEITTQDGSAYRFAAGDFHYVRPGALHHSNNPSQVPVTIFNLGLPGTPEDTGEYPFKKV